MRFADTAYFLALLNPRDQLHDQAIIFSQDQKIQLITTTWILVELANAVCASPQRQKFVDFTRGLIRMDAVRLIPANQDWFAQGFDFYRRRLDKEWSLTDCISFLVMQEHGVSEALTADHHFTQAGFRALLQN